MVETICWIAQKGHFSHQWRMSGTILPSCDASFCLSHQQRLHLPHLLLKASEVFAFGDEIKIIRLVGPLPI
jgi:hypothetical protein